jgi:hypothetical protein
VGPRAVLNAVVKRKIPSPLRESNPMSSKWSLPFKFFIQVLFVAFGGTDGFD